MTPTAAWTRFDFQAMGSPCVLHMDNPDVEVARLAEEEIRRIEQRYSRYLSGNLMASINDAARRGGSVDVDPETASLIDYAFSCHRASSGEFDITTGVLRHAHGGFLGSGEPGQSVENLLARVGMHNLEWRAPTLTFRSRGMELDFGGIAKEYAADQAASLAAKAGRPNTLVDLGGDLAAAGPRADGSAWTVSIRDPRRRGACLGRYPLSGGGLATSGDYERYVIRDGRRQGHLINPATGRSASGIVSVSVVAQSCLLAGSLSSIAMLKGRDAQDWIDGLGLDYLLLTEDGEIDRGGTAWTDPR